MHVWHTIYRLTLRLLPAAERRDGAREMEEVFAHCLAVERARRPHSWPLWAIRGVLDTIVLPSPSAGATRRAMRRSRSWIPSAGEHA